MASEEQYALSEVHPSNAKIIDTWKNDYTLNDKVKNIDEVLAEYGLPYNHRYLLSYDELHQEYIVCKERWERVWNKNKVFDDPVKGIFQSMEDLNIDQCICLGIGSFSE